MLIALKRSACLLVCNWSFDVTIILTPTMLHNMVMSMKVIRKSLFVSTADGILKLATGRYINILPALITFVFCQGGFSYVVVEI